jgi:hypothetical protein
MPISDAGGVREARGLADERVVRRRFVVSTIIVAIMALTALIVYVVFSS